MQKPDRRPIAVFDSGLGGLSVLACALELAPQENYVYLADLANAPYGERPLSRIRELVHEDVRLLLTHDVKALVVACNTATASCVALLRREYPQLPIVGMEPALKVAATRCSCGEAAVLATPATLSLSMFALLRSRCEPLVGVRPVPCAGLSDMIDHDADENALRDYLYGVLPPDGANVTSIVLGCTHYVLIAPLVKKLYPNKNVISGNEGTVRHMIDILKQNDLCAGDNPVPTVEYLSTLAQDGIEARMQRVVSDAKARRVWENFFAAQK